MKHAAILLPALALLFNSSLRAASYPEFEAPLLKQGRGIWLGTCAACHANSLSDAPQARDASAWRARIDKGRDMLLQHALNGFSSEVADMPPRGGNPNLSDADVNAALEYMLKLVSLSSGEK